MKHRSWQHVILGLSAGIGLAIIGAIIIQGLIGLWNFLTNF
jgi:hypothetical protein